jgi:asparagine synthase (glutamine-hydrolysing)
MSVQFGRLNFDGKLAEQDYLEKVQPLLLPYGPDDQGLYSDGAISMLYCAFQTTKESRCEKQPLVMASGSIITWDGRLDNRAELIRQLSDFVTSDSTDISIVVAAYERWGSSCFAQLLGDWALAIWDPRAHKLSLAKDPIGVRHLYYSFDDKQVTWSTILDPLVLFAGKTFTVCEEYVAGWLSFFPATHLTPYVGIHSVPPSSSVVLRPGKHTVTKYWDFDPHKRIRYSTDSEYEEHFRVAFGEAVRRRLRSDSPILAELSGGMDSSSIVCMADTIMANGAAETPRLDTISYYNDSEPNWNERPYFTKVEEERGRIGWHIDLTHLNRFDFELGRNHFAAIPGVEEQATEPGMQFANCLSSQGNRVVLSGIGGDEVTGGVPTPILELADLLSRAQVRMFAHQLKVWALNLRKPWFHLFFTAAGCFLPLSPFSPKTKEGAEAWLNSRLVKRNRGALDGIEFRMRLFGALPSFQGNISTLAGVQKQLGCEVLQATPPYEKRYPYLDRSLIEFMYSVPREQLVRPGRRRSLMRRALQNIVPSEILERKRKAYVERSPIVMLQTVRNHIETILSDPLSVQHGFIDPMIVGRSMIPILCGQDTKGWPWLMKTALFELWLKKQDRYLKPVESRQVQRASVPTFSRADSIQTDRAAT